MPLFVRGRRQATPLRARFTPLKNPQKTVKKRTAVQIYFDCGAPIATPQCIFSCTAVQFFALFTERNWIKKTTRTTKDNLFFVSEKISYFSRLRREIIQIVPKFSKFNLFNMNLICEISTRSVPNNNFSRRKISDEFILISFRR